MSPPVSRVFLCTLASLALVAVPVRGQQTPGDSAAQADPRPTWWERVSVSVHFGGLWPTADSELFALLDRALAPGSRAVRPDLLAGALHIRVTDRWAVRFGIEAGESTVASVSRIQPTSGTDPVRQQTTFELLAVPSLGAEWQAIRWPGRGSDAAERMRLSLGIGGGVARYRLSQRGDFVDAEQRIVFAEDFHSEGRGAFGYASAGIDVPLRRWLVLEGEIRRQIGSAPMSGDYAEFDRLDLGGTRLTAGFRISSPSATDGFR